MTNAIHPLPDVDPFDPLAGTLQSLSRGRQGGGFDPDSNSRFAEESRACATDPVAGMAGVNISILALDLANHTGYAVRRRDGKIIHGVESFTPRASWTPGQRWQRFRSWLSETIVAHNINAIAYEIVIQAQGRSSVAAGDVYGGYKALVELAADSHRLVLHPVHVATVKKTWTGNHMAKKPDMVAQAKVRGFRVEDDNEADALAILHWAIAKETGTWKPTPKRPKPKTKRAVTGKSPKASAAGQQGALL